MTKYIIIGVNSKPVSYTEAQYTEVCCVWKETTEFREYCLKNGCIIGSGVTGDAPIVRKWIKRWLEDMGCVLVCHSGREFGVSSYSLN